MKTLLFTLILLTAMNASAIAADYNYPIVNPLASTIVGTPNGHKAELKQAPLRLQQLQVFPDRKIPEIFYYDKGLRYGFAKQPKKSAPVMFVIGGTGAEYNSNTTTKMADIFYTLGYHVVTIPSSTNPNFMTTASTSSVTGPVQSDIPDYYRVMTMIKERLEASVEPQGYYLSGFSLGGFHAAFLSHHDEKHGAIGFQKVLIVNPPLSLDHSTQNLDTMLEDNIPGGMANISAFLDKLQAAVAELYVDSDRYLSSASAFNEDTLYAAYRYKNPSDQEMAAIIGMAFRAAAMNIAFTADVMTDAAYVVPGNYTPGPGNSTTEYFKILARLDFHDYYEGIVAPFYSPKMNMSAQALMNSQSLKKIENYLRSSNKIYLMHNRDDIIMKAGEVQNLASIFGSRARIYPTGGHLGNVDYVRNVSDIKEILGYE